MNFFLITNIRRKTTCMVNFYEKMFLNLFTISFSVRVLAYAYILQIAIKYLKISSNNNKYLPEVLTKKTSRDKRVIAKFTGYNLCNLY